MEESLEETLNRYRTALQVIFLEEGRVCPDYLESGCAHPSCRSSSHAWVIANDALFPPKVSPLLSAPKEKFNEP